MSIPSVRSDAEFLADNPQIVALLRERFPEASEEELARALRTAKWLLEPSEQLSEADLASYLLRERSGLSGRPGRPDKPLW
jgi:hypothetical protein